MGSSNGPSRKVVDNGSSNKPARPVEDKKVDDKTIASTYGSSNGPSRGQCQLLIYQSRLFIQPLFYILVALHFLLAA